MARRFPLTLSALGLLAWAIAPATISAPSAGPFPLPIVIWHGMGDSCCSPMGIGHIADNLRKYLGVYVYSIATGDGRDADVRSSYIGNINDQVAKVCNDLKEIPELQNGFNAVGFSQGGQFLRAVLQRCQHTGPRMHKLVTLGSQHEGVQNMPGCIVHTAGCKNIQKWLTHNAYRPEVQEKWIQAQFLKDPYRKAEYLNSSIFLADINNEREEKNEQYRLNLASLEKLVLFRFTYDIVVVPRDSSWFSFFDGTALIPMPELALFKEDWIGLKELYDRGDLIFGDCPTGHMTFTWDWFKTNVADEYLAANPALEEWADAV
ncbi:unnamed protein product [Ostreobium quekettii]|uniref:Palmitoyl-protein thioesterase 1 n=1 Tax=Ostreobium quekettii TaxID=121088 RepID=A0A8S1IQ52_9CHLO|nr:unnamed protein product [Ostreobium quekettii]|eukprot:evm.model.scf_158.9 EVM.evm.TU.scf_158.9   scf_158:103287-112630(+)